MEFGFDSKINDAPPPKRNPMPGDIFNSTASLTVKKIKRSPRERIEERLIPIIAVTLFCFISSIGIPSVVALQSSGQVELENASVNVAPPRVPVGDELRVPTSEAAPQGVEVNELSRQQLIGAMLDSTHDVARARAALSRAQSERMPYLFETCVLALKSSHPELEDAFLDCVAATGDSRAVPHIADLLHAPQVHTRLKALTVLEKLGGSKVSHLFEIRQFTESDAQVRSALSKSLQRIQPSSN